MKHFLNIFVIILAISANSRARRVKRLFRAFDAEENSFPHLVGLRIHMDKEDWPTWCGGSIIDPEWIITAAHCIQNATSVEILLGSTNVSAAKLNHHINRKDIIEHPDWNSHNMSNDIALVKMPYTEFSTEIQPIPLPANNNDINRTLVAAGWGYTNDTDNIIKNNLKMAYFDVLSNDACSQKYSIYITSNNICVTSTLNSSICGGDSGGPLATEDHTVLVGVSSFSTVAGCTKGYPSVFTRVSRYMDWIRSIIGKII